MNFTGQSQPFKSDTYLKAEYKHLLHPKTSLATGESQEILNKYIDDVKERGAGQHNYTSYEYYLLLFGYRFKKGQGAGVGDTGSTLTIESEQALPESLSTDQKPGFYYDVHKTRDNSFANNGTWEDLYVRKADGVPVKKNECNQEELLPLFKVQQLHHPRELWPLKDQFGTAYRRTGYVIRALFFLPSLDIPDLVYFNREMVGLPDLAIKLQGVNPFSSLPRVKHPFVSKSNNPFDNLDELNKDLPTSSMDYPKNGKADIECLQEEDFADLYKREEVQARVLKHIGERIHGESGVDGRANHKYLQQSAAAAYLHEIVGARELMPQENPKSKVKELLDAIKEKSLEAKYEKVVKGLNVWYSITVREAGSQLAQVFPGLQAEAGYMESRSPGFTHLLPEFDVDFQNMCNSEEVQRAVKDTIGERIDGPWGEDGIDNHKIIQHRAAADYLQHVMCIRLLSPDENPIAKLGELLNTIKDSMLKADYQKEIDLASSKVRYRVTIQETVTTLENHTYAETGTTSLVDMKAGYQNSSQAENQFIDFASLYKSNEVKQRVIARLGIPTYGDFGINGRATHKNLKHSAAAAFLCEVLGIRKLSPEENPVSKVGELLNTIKEKALKAQYSKKIKVSDPNYVGYEISVVEM